MADPTPSSPDSSKSIFVSRTNIVNGIALILGAVVVFKPGFELTVEQQTAIATLIMLGLPVINWWLRWITKGAVHLVKKEDEA